MQLIRLLLSAIDERALTHICRSDIFYRQFKILASQQALFDFWWLCCVKFDIFTFHWQLVLLKVFTQNKQKVLR